MTEGKRFVQFDRVLDRGGFGPAWLRQDGIAKIVVAAIEDAVQAKLCTLHAYVVMPNHVHLLLDPKVDLKLTTRMIKGRSARRCNQLLGREGQAFWQEESFDHWVRHPASFEKIRTYIELNPVKAGLAKTPAEWEWSSAHK